MEQTRWQLFCFATPDCQIPGHKAADIVGSLPACLSVEPYPDGWR